MCGTARTSPGSAAKIDAARKAGYKIVLYLGLQYAPEWACYICPVEDQFPNLDDKHVNAVSSYWVRDEIAGDIQWGVSRTSARIPP